ncbi:MAG: hypothetical protein GY850_19985 [bacterium]|nr:hypothetical protein [bacterium]
MKYSEMFRVKPGSKIRLGKIDAGFKDKHEKRTSALAELDKYTKALRVKLA